MESSVEHLEKNLSILSKEIIDIKELIGTGFKKVGNNFDSIKKEIDSLHLKVDFLTKKVTLLEGNTTEGFGDVGLKLENLTDEISKIADVTNYGDLYDNMKTIKN